MLKLGRVYKGDEPKQKLRTYLIAKTLAPAPREVTNSLALSQDIGMAANDQIGDCTAADISHGIVITTALNKGIYVPATASVIKFYSGCTGYDPSQTDAQGNNPTDRGASLTEAANYAIKVGIDGHKLHGRLDVDQSNPEHIKQCLSLFGQFALGVQLPKSAMDGFGKGIWSNITDTNILGGHDIIGFDYDDEGVVFGTWNALQKATWAWIAQYADEAQARIYEDNIDTTSGYDLSAAGFDLAQYDADMAMV